MGRTLYDTHDGITKSHSTEPVPSTAKMKLWLGLFLCWQLFSVTDAREAPLLNTDSALEQRLNAITQDFRCLVCQNESMADSQADLAQDLRREIRHLIQSGKTDDDIKEFLVSRYGDFVLYQPPLKPVTWLLWWGPLLILLCAVFLMIHTVKPSKKVTHQ